MRIFHVITAIQPGGAEIIAQLLAKYAKRDHDSVYFVIVRAPKNGIDKEYTQQFVKLLDELNVTIVEMTPKLFPFSVPLNALKLINRFKFTKKDIVHLHTDIPEFYGAFVRLFSNVRIIRTIHNTKFWPENRYIGRFVEIILNGSERVGVSKRALIEHDIFLNNYGISPKGRKITIYNGIETPLNSSPSGTCLGINHNVTNFLFIGRLEEQKGADILIDALTELNSNIYSKTCFHLIGDGVMKGPLQQLVAEYNLPVKFHGALHNASQYIPHFDCVVIPSRFEGFGLVAAESILQGCQVIAMDAPGLNEVFEDTNEQLIPLNNVVALAKAIAKMIESPELQVPKKETLELFRSKFSAKKMGQKYLDLYGN